MVGNNRMRGSDTVGLTGHPFDENLYDRRVLYAVILERRRNLVWNELADHHLDPTVSTLGGTTSWMR